MFDSSSADRDIICEDNYNLYSTCYSGYWKASRNGCIRRCWTISNGCQHSWGFDSLFKIFLALFCKCKSCGGKVFVISTTLNLLFACVYGSWKFWWKFEYTLIILKRIERWVNNAKAKEGRESTFTYVIIDASSEYRIKACINLTYISIWSCMKLNIALITLIKNNCALITW